jgi:hypothetical protein
MKKLFKEPLLHFLLIGAALFGLQALLQPRQLEAPAARRIVISQGDIERLRLTWQMQWQRPPTVEEWQGLGIGISSVHRWGAGRVALRVAGAVILGAGILFFWNALT